MVYVQILKRYQGQNTHATAGFSDKGSEKPMYEAGKMLSEDPRMLELPGPW